MVTNAGNLANPELSKGTSRDSVSASEAGLLRPPLTLWRRSGRAVPNTRDSPAIEGIRCFSRTSPRSPVRC